MIESKSVTTLTRAGKPAVIVAAFLGWFFAGMHLGITSLAMGSASKDLLKSTGNYEESAAISALTEDQSTDRNATAPAPVELSEAGQRLQTDSSKWFGYYV